MSRADLEQALLRLDVPIKASTSVLHANGVCHTLLVPWCNRRLEWRVRCCIFLLFCKFPGKTRKTEQNCVTGIPITLLIGG